MSSFTLLITSPNVDSGMSFHASKFAEQLLVKGHQINGIFFYSNGVTNANALTLSANQNIDAYQAWRQIAEQHQVAMFSCVTAANTRGVLSQQDARDVDKSHYNLAPFVTSAGLGELVSLCNCSDRVVQF